MEGELNFALPSLSLIENPTSCCSSSAVAGEPSSSAAPDLFEFRRQQILREIQSAVHRYNDCFQSLCLACDDLELLREENLVLRAENLELSLLLEEQKKEEALAATPGVTGALCARSGIRQIGAAGKENVPPAKGIDAGNGKVGARGVVPKSISIRSRGFLEAEDPAAGGGGAFPKEVGDAVYRPSTPLPLGSVQVGDEAGGSGIAVPVYNQGTAKTELCNKWEEMGWCPYGDLCQFAHGVEELRPVIRHPRYKTQLCRMINVPGGCPYGHRCHFRHALPIASNQNS